jgi:hypothetical protein
MLPFIQRNALRRFVSGKPGPWGAVAVVAIGMRTMQRMGARRSNVVFRQELPPGQELLVTHRADLTQREARSRRRRKADAREATAAQKAAKQEARRVKRAAAAPTDVGT